jgi:CrcB protein
MMRAAYVAIGGGIGSLARYWLAGIVQQLGGTEFPLGTLAVNVSGSLVLGVVMTLSLERGIIDADLRTLLAIGLCGGFTTMSTFSYETLALLRDGSMAMAGINIAASLSACLIAVWLGGTIARFL